jgi:hypothetical protein
MVNSVLFYQSGTDASFSRQNKWIKLDQAINAGAIWKSIDLEFGE